MIENFPMFGFFFEIPAGLYRQRSEHHPIWIDSDGAFTLFIRIMSREHVK